MTTPGVHVDAVPRPDLEPVGPREGRPVLGVEPATVVRAGDQRPLRHDREPVECPPRARAAGELEPGVDPDLVHAAARAVAPEPLAEDLARSGENGRPDVELPGLHRLDGLPRVERRVDQVMRGGSRRRRQHLDGQVVADRPRQQRPRLTEERAPEPLQVGSVDPRLRSSDAGATRASAATSRTEARIAEVPSNPKARIPFPSGSQETCGLAVAPASARSLLDALREPAHPPKVEVERLGERVPRLVRSRSEVARRLPAADPLARPCREGGGDQPGGRRRDPHDLRATAVSAARYSELIARSARGRSASSVETAVARHASP